MENAKGVLQKINSISFIQVTDDNGKTKLFIPAWSVALAIVLFILVRRKRTRL